MIWTMEVWSLIVCWIRAEYARIYSQKAVDALSIFESCEVKDSLINEHFNDLGKKDLFRNE